MDAGQSSPAIYEGIGDSESDDVISLEVSAAESGDSDAESRSGSRLVDDNEEDNDGRGTTWLIESAKKYEAVVVVEEAAVAPPPESELELGDEMERSRLFWAECLKN